MSVPICMNDESPPPLRMPAEWQPQAAIWLSWPHNIETWPENLAEAQAEFVGLAKTIAATQPVCVMVGGEALESAQRTLDSITGLTLIEIPTNDAWARDYAPTFVKQIDGKLNAIDWYYNAWGEKYPPFDEDQKVARRIADYLEIQSIAPDLCFEGGAIDVNDSGILLTTISCALDPNRNPDKSLEEVEDILCGFLGARNCVWLTGGQIEGDDTDGHIDQLARFTDDRTIVYAWTDDQSDPQQLALRGNLDDLERELPDRNRYRLIPLPMPERIEFLGRRIPASYCNFLITNQHVIVPQYDVAGDSLAIEILKPLFPNRQVIGLPSNNLSVGLGSFHCLSQQQPA